LAYADYLATLAEKCGEDSESSPQFSALQSEPREAKKKGRMHMWQIDFMSMRVFLSYYFQEDHPNNPVYLRDI
jgi:hypothetical protein